MAGAVHPLDGVEIRQAQQGVQMAEGPRAVEAFRGLAGATDPAPHRPSHPFQCVAHLLSAGHFCVPFFGVSRIESRVSIVSVSPG